MKILWLFVLVHAVTAVTQPGFGKSYLRNSRLCQQWSCINTKLGLLDSLPTTEQFGEVLRTMLPSEWHHVVDRVLQVCYNDRPRRYSNTCPGQAIMHCAVDQLIANCPESYQRKGDACAPVNSLAGFKNMFTQSRYENMETNMAVDRRPAWFLKNYFSTKCCNLPQLFSASTLFACGISNIIQYYVHNPTIPRSTVLHPQMQTTPTPANEGDSLQVVDLKDFLAGNTPITTDPLECCNISEFIQPSWRQECNFQLAWDRQSRLVIKDDGNVITTEGPTTSRPVVRRDVTIVPQSCEKETCVFSKLNIITDGSVDLDAFSRLLDNLTANQPSWTKAKGRVLTTCLRKPVTEYEAHCDINNVLACTFDVLSENCPNATKNDLCKHTTTERTCQISSSKYRPKHRREVCPLPELLDRSILTECGLTSISKTEPVTTVVKPKTYKWHSSKNKCHDLTPSTSCILSKMGVLNKYGFLDYFKMKDRIRNFAVDKGPAVEAIFISAFNMDLLYTEHCNSAKKFLNVLDTILTTCPKQKSQNTAQCAAISNQMNNPEKRNLTSEYSQRILDHFLHVFTPLAKPSKVYLPRYMKKIRKTPIYHFGLLNDKYAPKVTTIDVKPKSRPLVEKPKALVEKPPLVLLPVYMRVPHSNLMIRRPFVASGVLRSNFPMNNPTNQAHVFSKIPSVSTTDSVTTSLPMSTVKPISPKKHFSTRFVTPKIDKFEMLKPE